MERLGFFYRSKKMDEARVRLGFYGKNYAKQLITGKVVRYSEWAGKFPYRPMMKWDDCKLVAIGYFDHHEP